MGATTTVALITVGGTLGGALLALVGTLITQYVTGRKEDQRRQHERDLKSMELEESKLEKRREEHLNAYRTFVSRLDLMAIYSNKEALSHFGVEEADSAPIIEKALDAHGQIKLLSSREVNDAADNLVEVTFAAMREPGVRSIEPYEIAFLEVARKELGAQGKEL